MTLDFQRLRGLAALITLGAALAACGDPAPLPTAVGPVKGAPLYEPQPAAADTPESTQPESGAAVSASATETVPLKPIDPSASDTANGASGVMTEPVDPATVPAVEPTADAADVVTDNSSKPGPDGTSTPSMDEPATDKPVADKPETTKPTPDVPVSDRVDGGDVGDLGTPEDRPKTTAKKPAADPAADATAEIEPAKPAAAVEDDDTDDDELTAAEKAGDAKIVTFDELASFVWIDPGGPAAKDPSGLAPPDPNADAAAAEQPVTEHSGPAGEARSDVPKKIKKLSGRRVAIEGYMIPLEFDEDGAVRKFLISRYMMGCCFGMVPAANELVLVEMKNTEGAVYEPYLTVLATGKFSVHDKGNQLGSLKTLYKLEADDCKFVLDR